MRRISIAVLVLAGTGSWPSIHAEAEVLSVKPVFWACPEPQERQKRLGFVIKNLSAMVDRIEHVPPDEKRYLDDELAAAAEQKNEGRYNLAAARPMYRPLMVSRSYDEIVETLTSASKSQDARTHIIGAGKALAALPNFLGDLQDYIEFDRRRTPRIYDESGFYFNRSTVTVLLGDLVECAALSLKAG